MANEDGVVCCVGDLNRGEGRTEGIVARAGLTADTRRRDAIARVGRAARTGAVVANIVRYVL